MLSRFVKAFFPRSKHILISWLQSLSAVILESRKVNSVTVSIVTKLFAMRASLKWDPDAMILVSSMLYFKPAFPLSSFTLIKRFFSSYLLSVIRMVSSAYLKLLIFLPAIMLPACASSSTVFHMMHSAYKLNKQDDNIQPWHTPFPILDLSFVLCLVLTVASCPEYRFPQRLVRCSGILIYLRIFHSHLWSTQSKSLVELMKEK